MAFKRVMPELADQMAAAAAKQCGVLGGWHAAAAAELLKAAANQTDANQTLAAIATWRHDQEEHRLRWCRTALVQIASGDRPEDVCTDLGFGRTALQQTVRAEDSELAAFARFLYSPRPKQQRKEAS